MMKLICRETKSFNKISMTGYEAPNNSILFKHFYRKFLCAARVENYCSLQFIKKLRNNLAIVTAHSKQIRVT